MSKGLEYIRDISCLISENYSDKEPLTEEQKLSKNCFLDYCKCIEKELKAFEIIKEKKVIIDLLIDNSYVEDYNNKIIIIYGYTSSAGRLLTQEEFDLLKRWVENETN